MRTNSNTIVNLNKVSYAKFYYRNRSDNTHLDKYPSDTFVNGSVLSDPNVYAIPFDICFPHETRLERAKRLDIVETWTPVLKLSLSNNHTLIFENSKALKLWGAWRNYILKK